MGHRLLQRGGFRLTVGNNKFEVVQCLHKWPDATLWQSVACNSLDDKQSAISGSRVTTLYIELAGSDLLLSASIAVYPSVSFHQLG